MRPAELAEKLGVNRLVIRGGETAPSDAALIGDDDVEPAMTTEFGESFRSSGTIAGLARDPRQKFTSFMSVPSRSRKTARRFGALSGSSIRLWAGGQPGKPRLPTGISPCAGSFQL